MTGLVLSLLVTVASLGGLLLPSTYAQETATWAAQAVGQDWVNLLVVAPWLAVTAIGTGRGSLRAALLLGGALLYMVYSSLLYAFAVHFNSLFLVYCGCLSVSTFGLCVRDLASVDLRSR